MTLNRTDRTFVRRIIQFYEDLFGETPNHIYQNMRWLRANEQTINSQIFVLDDYPMQYIDGIFLFSILLVGNKKSRINPLSLHLY